MTRGELAAALRAIGVREGGVLMVHTRMRAIGRVDGAEDGVVGALLDALGPGGTLMAYTSWEEHEYAVVAEAPEFDPATAPAAADHGRIPERVRTWPGARRSVHPESSVAAVGARAEWLTRDHPQQDGYGPASPFGRLCEAGGQVLMLGAPLETITLLHHAEAIARVAGKRTATFNAVVVGMGERTYTDIDSTLGAVEYERLGLTEDAFAVIGREALEAGIGSRGTVGAADCALYPARELAAFGAAWIEARFGAIPLPAATLADDAVALRPWRESDVPAQLEAFADPVFERFSDWAPRTHEDARRRLAELEAARVRGEQLELAVVEAGDHDTVLGGASLNGVDLAQRRAAVGYWLAPAARGRGAATRAVRLLARWAFDDLGIARIELTCGPDNEASQRVAERCGFTREGLLRSHLPFKDGRRDTVIYALLPGELRRVRGARARPRG